MKILLSALFGVLLALFGISVLDKPVEAIILLVLFNVALFLDDIVSLFVGKK